MQFKNRGVPPLKNARGFYPHEVDSKTIKQYFRSTAITVSRGFRLNK
jgi:hypothetical protein